MTHTTKRMFDHHRWYRDCSPLYKDILKINYYYPKIWLTVFARAPWKSPRSTKSQVAKLSAKLKTNLEGSVKAPL